MKINVYERLKLKNPKEQLEIKNVVTYVKSSFSAVISRLKAAKVRISDLKDRSREMLQKEMKRENIYFYKNYVIIFNSKYTHNWNTRRKNIENRAKEKKSRRTLYFIIREIRMQIKID